MDKYVIPAVFMGIIPKKEMFSVYYLNINLYLRKRRKINERMNRHILKRTTKSAEISGDNKKKIRRPKIF